MKKREWSFDPKCYELAEYFMNMHAPSECISELAQIIQDAIEDSGLLPAHEELDAPFNNADTPFAENH